MTHIPSNDEHPDGERLLRSSLQRALLKPAPESIARAVQARLAALPTPSPWLRGLMRYGGVVGVTVLLAAVIMVVVIGEPTSATPSVAMPDRTFTSVLHEIALVPTPVSATTVCIIVFLLYGFLSTELSRR
ncbi:MAG: hypothetical protein JSS89_02035 [Bacteroidetes bacterium]|nr:hypothetical protein [Bacteroidota bacterium]